MKIAARVVAIILTVFSISAPLSAASEEDTPGTRAYFDAYIDGRYGHTNAVMYSLFDGPSLFPSDPERVKGSVLQVVDSEKLLVVVKSGHMGLKSDACDNYSFEPLILIVADAKKYSEGQAVLAWAKKSGDYACVTSDGQTNKLAAYKTPIPNAISFDDYEALVKGGVQTPDRIKKIVSCEMLPAVERSRIMSRRGTNDVQKQEKVAELNRMTIDQLRQHLTKLEAEHTALREKSQSLYRDRSTTYAAMMAATGTDKDKAVVAYQKAEEAFKAHSSVAEHMKYAEVQLARSVFAERVKATDTLKP